MFDKSFMGNFFDVCKLFGPKLVLELTIGDKGRLNSYTHDILDTGIITGTNVDEYQLQSAFDR